jgi:hypothetical protein
VLKFKVALNPKPPKVPIVPYTTIRGAASLDWTKRPGNYSQVGLLKYSNLVYGYFSNVAMTYFGKLPRASFYLSIPLS